MKQLENIQQLKVYNYKYGDDFANYAGMATVDRQDTGVLAQVGFYRHRLEVGV